MKPDDDPWLKTAHANAETLDREIKNLIALTGPIRESRPIITKYQVFWNKAKEITTLFKELKPLAKSDRDLLWKRFNALCRDTKEKQKAEYGTLESMSRRHMEEIMKLADLSALPPGARAPAFDDLVERGQALKNASDQLARFKHAMIAHHKKACFDRIQAIRKTHDAAWGPVKAEMPRHQRETLGRLRKNLETNRERLRKAASALENFQIGRAHITEFLATNTDPGKHAAATARLADTEARIADIEKGIRQLESWIAEDQKRLNSR